MQASWCLQVLTYSRPRVRLLRGFVFQRKHSDAYMFVLYCTGASTLVSAGLDPEQAKKQPFIASMGIYVFKKDVLVQLLKNKYPGSNDFGGEIIPMAAKDGLKTVAYLFNDYWEDIGTIKSFFDANLALAETVSLLDIVCEHSLSMTSG